ncbi:unnamed protein product, partial [Ixodes hexagonus]
MLNLVIEREELEKKANTLAELNDLVYACQLTYEEVTLKPKKEVNWKEAIKKKIEKFSQQLQIVTSHKQNEAPSRALKRICKANQYHSNNEDQLKKLEDQIEEKRAVFQKKLVIAANRTEYRRTNKQFEFNRSAFYRR